MFTDTNTHYTSKNVVGSSTATSNTTSALTNGNVYLNSVENGVVTSTHKISGSGATTVTTDASGNIIISSTDNNTTYGAAGSSLGLVKSGGDVTISSGTITVNDDSHNHVISNVDGLQGQLDSINSSLNNMSKSFYEEDLNAITWKTSGYCYGCTNRPSGATNGYLEVIYGSSNLILQRYTNYGSVVSWSRQFLDGANWSEWTKEITTASFSLSGTTLTITTT